MRKYNIQTLRQSWGAGFGMGKQQVIDSMSTVEFEKVKSGYKSRSSYPVCFLCLNFSDQKTTHHVDTKLPCNTRYTVIGHCWSHDWEVSAFDVCDFWQDDA